MAGKFIHYAIASLALIGVVKMIDQVQASPEKVTPFCHGRNVQGQVTDLSSLCQMNPALPSPSPAASPSMPTSRAQPAAAKAAPPAKNVRVIVKPEATELVEFSEVRFDPTTNQLVGTVKNKKREPLENGGLSYEVHTSGDRVNWKKADGGSICFQEREIPGRKNSEFEGRVPVDRSGNTRITITRTAANVCIG